MRIANETRFRHGVLFLMAAVWLATSRAAAEEAKPKGLGDPGELVSIANEATRGAQSFALTGRDAAQQLVITGTYGSGQVHDMTSDVKYEARPAGIVNISATGYVTSVAEGETTIRATSANKKQARAKVTVTHLVEDLPVNFPNEVVPIFTKLGCNSGSCHGKASGQNGFRLSLLGFEPQEDYEHLVKESRGRRLFPAAPKRSLLLLKSTGARPHGGGVRFATDSPAYRVIVRWIEQGMPYGEVNDPVVSRIEVLPRERLMNPHSRQQIMVVAHYSDGSKRDVTRMAQFESNEEEMAEVDEQGAVTSGSLPGSVAVMVRYQSQVDVFRATVPYGEQVDNLPQPNNFIDELVWKKLKQLGLPPSAVCDDATFLRRVTIDVAGRLPTGEEAEKFLADTDSTKRAKWIDSLIESNDYADYFAGKWSAILRNHRTNNSPKQTTFAFHAWIRQSLHSNKPYDKFVREVLTAAGEAGRSAPVTWYHEVKSQSSQVEDTAQLFLGLRIQCARCHHHPFERWSQQDYYALAAFFSRVGRKPSGLSRNRDHIYHKRGTASAKNPKTGQQVKPAGLGSDPLDIRPEDDPRHRLVDWMTDEQNPFFAKALVNRYWKHFFGRGLVNPEDDMRVTNPATNPELLDAVATHFKKSRFDLKDLVRTIVNSKTYQLSAEPNVHNKNDKQNFSRFYPRRLNAEVLLDSIDTVTKSRSRFGGTPVGTRAVQLPDNAFSSYFLTVFGRPDSASACECERSIDATLAQSLHLLNSSEILGKVGGARTAQLASDKRPHEERIRELYLIAFSRPPNSEETQAATEYLKRNEKKVKGAYEDLVWVLLNTKEFLFNH